MNLFWAHDDCLGDEIVSPAIYVFDEVRLRDQQWTLKRIGFLYECLLELPVEIRRGDVVIEVLNFASSINASCILSVTTPDPRINKLGREIAESVPVNWIDPEPFVIIPPDTDLRRFSRYWKRAERVLING